MKSYFLSFYREKGFAQGYLVALVLLSCALGFIFFGIFAFTELWLELDFFSFIDDTPILASSSGRSLGIKLILIFILTLFVLFFFPYRKWVSDYKKMTEKEQYIIHYLGDSIKTKILMSSLLFAVTMLILSAIFGG